VHGQKEGDIRLDPNLAAAWRNKGSALAGQDKYDEAIQAYDEAIKAYDEAVKINSQDAKAWINNKSHLLDLLGRKK
jgi:tetratricopeptide (TPR) repeat protein